jgi:uncharacterized protein YkwD
MALTRRTFLIACLAPWPVVRGGEERAADTGRDPAGTIEQVVLALTNQLRIERRVAPLGPSDALAAIARRHSQDMLNRGYFGHCTPEGLHSADRIAKGGLDFDATGENIYMIKDATAGPADVASAMVKGWMNSRGHRTNILTPAYRVVGVGVAATARIVLATQLFGGSAIARSVCPRATAEAKSPKPRAESLLTPPLPPAPRRRRGLSRA